MSQRTGHVWKTLSPHCVVRGWHFCKAHLVDTFLLVTEVNMLAINTFSNSFLHLLSSGIIFHVCFLAYSQAECGRFNTFNPLYGLFKGPYDKIKCTFTVKYAINLIRPLIFHLPSSTLAVAVSRFECTERSDMDKLIVNFSFD